MTWDSHRLGQSFLTSKQQSETFPVQLCYFSLILQVSSLHTSLSPLLTYSCFVSFIFHRYLLKKTLTFSSLWGNCTYSGSSSCSRKRGSRWYLGTDILTACQVKEMPFSVVGGIWIVTRTRCSPNCSWFHYGDQRKWSSEGDCHCSCNDPGFWKIWGESMPSRNEVLTDSWWAVLMPCREMIRN